MFRLFTYKNLAKFKLYPILLVVIFIVFGIISMTNFFSTKADSAAPDPAVVGSWSEVYEWPVKATHTSLLPDGKVLTWPSYAGDSPYIWDPSTNTISPAAQAGYNIFCSGHTVLADGKIFVAGGHVTTPTGLKTASIYDPATNAWTRLPDMNDARWYPTVTSLPGGNVLVAAGTITNGIGNKLPQVWDYKTDTWRDLTSAQLGLPLYPWLFLTPNGKIFMAGSTQSTRLLDFTNTGSWGPIIKSNYGKRTYGSAAMYAPGKIIITGGATNNDNASPTKTAEIIDLTAANPKWTYTGQMAMARKHGVLTLLPTGEVLMLGGTRGSGDDKTLAVFQAETWDPATGKWSLLSKNKIYRGYHSSSLLLPDGRVLLAGGEVSGTSAEVFSPPYLFKGTRPTISEAPSNVNNGETFTIKTPDKVNINKIRWIRNGSVTHAFNMSQVINDLEFTKTSTGIDIKVPGKNSTPPGYYMLFILNKNGVPSVAKMVKVGNINIDTSTFIAPTSEIPAAAIDVASEDAAHNHVMDTSGE